MSWWIGIGIGVSVLVALMALRRVARRRFGRSLRGGPWSGAWRDGGCAVGPHGHGHRGGRGRRAGMWFALRRLKLGEHEEAVVRAELGKLRTALRERREEWQLARQDLATAFQGAHLDTARVAAMFNRHDTVLQEIRAELTDSLQRMHEAMNDEQRGRVAAWLSRR